MKIPAKIKLIKKPDFLHNWHNAVTIDEVEIGEIGQYFKHGDCYNFTARNGYVPHVSRRKALRNNLHFEKLAE